MFSVPDLNVICTDRCEETALECIVECVTDVNCISACLRDETKCINGKRNKILNRIKLAS